MAAFGTRRGMPEFVAVAFPLERQGTGFPFLNAAVADGKDFSLLIQTVIVIYSGSSTTRCFNHRSVNQQMLLPSLAIAAR
jgi:hypothetical protein